MKCKSDEVQIRLNGETRDIRKGLNLGQLLDSLQINRYTVVVECNEAAVRRDELETVLVSEGDIIEIVRIIGGGVASWE